MNDTTALAAILEGLLKQGPLVGALVYAVLYFSKKADAMTERYIADTKERDKAYADLVAAQVRALEDLKGAFHDEK